MTSKLKLPPMLIILLELKWMNVHEAIYLSNFRPPEEKPQSDKKLKFSEWLSASVYQMKIFLGALLTCMVLPKT